MREYKGFMDMSFTDWIIFKMIIAIYGEDKLIEMLKAVKKIGGIKEMRTMG